MNRRIQFRDIAIGFASGLISAVIVAIISTILNLPDDIRIALFFIFGVGIGVLFSWSTKRHPVVTLRYAIVVLLVIGILMGLSSYQEELWAQVSWDSAIASMGIGLVSLSVAAYAYLQSLQSDARMQDMANLEFYEKIAVLEYQIYNVRNCQDVVVENIYNDIKGAMQLRKHVDPRIKQELDNKIRELIDVALEGQPYANLVKRLQDLLQEDS